MTPKKPLTNYQKRLLSTLKAGGWISAKANGKITYTLFNKYHYKVRQIRPSTFANIAYSLKLKKEGKSSKNKEFVIWVHKKARLE